MKELSFKVKELTIENETLKAEVELYSASHAGGASSSGETNSSHNAPTPTTNNDNDATRTVLIDCDDFVRSGQGVFAGNSNVDSNNATGGTGGGGGGGGTGGTDVITLSHIHGNSNPLCCALSFPDYTILATGGADGYLSLLAWGSGRR